MAIKNFEVGKWYKFENEDHYFLVLDKNIGRYFAYPCIRYDLEVKGIEYNELNRKIIEGEKNFIEEVPFKAIDYNRIAEFFKHLFKGTRGDIQAMFRYF